MLVPSSPINFSEVLTRADSKIRSRHDATVYYCHPHTKALDLSRMYDTPLQNVTSPHTYLSAD